VSDSTTSLLRDALPLLGVVVGGLLAAFMGAAGDKARWRRDYLMDLHRREVDFLGEAIIAMDGQYVVLGKSVRAALGTRPDAVPIAEVKQADAAWGRALALRVVSTQPVVQQALSDFDVARGACVDAINSGKVGTIAATYSAVDVSRLRVLEASDATLNAVGLHVMRHVLPLRVRLWRRVRGRPENEL
jgi:hypothetical protein